MTKIPRTTFGSFQPRPDELLQLFAIPVGISHYNMDYSEELEYLRNIKLRLGKLNRQSEDTFILHRPEMANIRAFIEGKINLYAREVMSLKNKLRITQSWVNNSRKGDSHHEHVHPNSILSGVWYPFLNDKLPPLELYNKNTRDIELQVRKINPYNGTLFKVNQIKSGGLIIFPSNLPHGVSPNESDEERISLSLNTWTEGDIGDVDSLTYLPQVVVE